MERSSAHWIGISGIFDNDATKGPQIWLKEELERDVPVDRLVHDLLASDSIDKYAKSVVPTGEVASRVDVPEMQLATTVSQVFLGIQLKCASCHDSFVDRWKMTDAWGLGLRVAVLFDLKTQRVCPAWLEEYKLVAHLNLVHAHFLAAIHLYSVGMLRQHEGEEASGLGIADRDDPGFVCISVEKQVPDRTRPRNELQ